MMRKDLLKLVILSLCLKIAVIYPLSLKTSSWISNENKTAASKRVGATDEKHYRLPNESHLPHWELDDATAKSHNSTDEDNGSRIVLSTPLSSEMHVNGTKTPFNCSKSLYTRLRLKVSNLPHSSNMNTECKSDDEIVVESFIVTFFVYCTFSFICAWACIISVPKFVALFLISNVLTFFWIIVIPTGSDSMGYYLPSHVNFLFILFTGWSTILSCEVVFEVLKSHGILSVSNGEIVGNRFKILLVTFAISCLLKITCGPILKTLGSGPYIVHRGNSQMMDGMMGLYLLSVYIVLFLVMVVVAAISSNQKKEMQDSGVRHTKYQLLYFCYHLFALDLWMYRFYVTDIPLFWILYFIAAMALPIFFLIDVIMTYIENLSILDERTGNPVKI